MEVFINDREISDIEIFQNLGKGIPLFMTGHTNCLQVNYNNVRRVSSFLKTERNNICVANVSDQAAYF
jgi:hypothetical protein